MLGQVSLDADVPVPRRDGTVLRADVYRPTGGGRHPVLVHRTPYDKRVAQSYWYAPPSWYAAQGYAVVVEDVRGRGRSGGVFAPLAHEAADGADCVRWAAEQRWSDGQVGWYGYSYCGVAQLLAAGEDDLPLAAIAPAMALPGLGEGGLRQNGVVNLAFAVSWAVELGILQGGRAPNGDPLTTLTAEALAQLLQVPLGRLLQHPTGPAGREALAAWPTGADDGRDEPIDPRAAHHRIRASVLHVGGWYDTFRAGTIGHFRASSQARREPGRDYLVMAPWTHQPVRSEGRPSPLPPAQPASWHIDELQLAFFDHVLRGASFEQPTVRLALTNSAVVRHAAQWPPPEAVPVDWHLASGGRANSAAGDGRLGTAPDGAADHLVYAHDDPAPSIGGDDCCAPLMDHMGPRDQHEAESRRDVLVYTSPPVTAPLTAAGEAEVVLYVATAEAASQWVCRLCLVTRDGVSVNLCDGVARVAGDPGEVQRVVVPLGPTGFRVDTGERLRLQVTGGSHPRWQGLFDPDGVPAVTRAVVLHDVAHPSAVRVPTLR